MQEIRIIIRGILFGTLKVQRTPTTIIPSLIGLFVAGNDNLNSFILMGLTVFFLHSSANAINDIADYRADTINSPERLSVKKTMSFKQLAVLSISFLLLGLGLAFFLDWILFTIVSTVGIILWAAYNFGAKLKDRPIGSLIYLSLSTSTIPFIAGFIIMRNLNAESFTFSLMLSFFSTPIIIDSLKDVGGDSMVGKQTLAVLLGKENIEKFLYFLIIMPLIIYPLIPYLFNFSQIYLIYAVIPLSLRLLASTMMVVNKRLISIRILIRIILAIDFIILSFSIPNAGLNWN